MVEAAIWHGSKKEQHELALAVANNCGCTSGPMGVNHQRCEAHTGLIEDQRWLNGLLIERRQAARWRRSEWSTCTSKWTVAP
jgi:ketol-acid reductoisomerase